MWLTSYLERRSTQGPRAAGISREEGLVQLLFDVTDPPHDVLDRFGHVMLRYPLYDVYRVGPQGVRKIGDLETTESSGRFSGSCAIGAVHFCLRFWGGGNVLI